MCNTSVQRLQSHRNVCKDIKSNKNQLLHKRKERDSNDSTNIDDILNNNESEISQPNITESNTQIKSVFSIFNKKNYQVCNNSNNTELVITSGSSKTEKLKNFIDSISENEIIKINESLLELLVVLNVGFEYTKSKYLKNLVNKLRPSYKLPTTEELSELLPNVYKKHLNSIPRFETSGTLLIYKTTNDKQFLSAIGNEHENLLYVYSEESVGDIESFIIISISLAKPKYNVDVHAVVCDSYVKTLESGVCFFVGLSKQLGLLIKSITMTDIFKNFQLLLDDCKIIEKGITLASGVKVDFIDDQDLCSYYKATLSCFKNLKIMRQLLIENETTFSNNCTLILLNANFEKDLGELLNVFKHIYNIIEKRNIPDSHLPAVCQQIDGRVCQENAGSAGSCGATYDCIRLRICRQMDQ